MPGERRIGPNETPPARRDVTHMKKECQSIRAKLADYLRGHVFRSTRSRIERHVASCVVCHSELDTLRRVEETRQLLTDLNESEGLGHRFGTAFSLLSGLKKLFYRPVLSSLIVLVLAGIYYYMLMPRQIDIDIDAILSATTPTTPPPASFALREAPMQHEKSPAAEAIRTSIVSTLSATSAGAPEPFKVTITPLSQAAVRQINDVLRGHGSLSRHQFSDREKEISGYLTTTELITLFNRISPVAKVSYNKKRLEMLPSAQQIPFVLTLTTMQKAAAVPAPVTRPAATPLDNTVASAGVTSVVSATIPSTATAP